MSDAIYYTEGYIGEIRLSPLGESKESDIQAEEYQFVITHNNSNQISTVTINGKCVSITIIPVNPIKLTEGDSEYVLWTKQIASSENQAVSARKTDVDVKLRLISHPYPVGGLADAEFLLTLKQSRTKVVDSINLTSAW